MDNITKFLLDFFLIRNFAKVVRTRVQQVQDWISKVRPFSWEATLLLSLFSWFVMLLLEGIYVRKFVSIFAWGFLIIGVEWALLGKKFKIPLIEFQFHYAPWLSGIIACIALFSNDFIIRDWRGVLINWPIFSAVFASYPKFIQTGLKIQQPGPDGRQDLVLLFLVSGLLSSWFRFHFLVQDILQFYPNLLADDFSRSAFVNRIKPGPRPTSRGYALLDSAEAQVREELQGKTWIEAQRWLNSLKGTAETPGIEAELSNRIIDREYGEQLPREQEIWQIVTETTFNSANPSQVELLLRAEWQGASSREGGYALRRLCVFSEVVNPAPESFADMKQNSTFQIQCQPTREELPTPAIK